MKKVIKFLKKHYKMIVVALVLIIIVLLCVFVYKNIFKSGISERLEGIENYTLTEKEISKIEEKFNELEVVSDIELKANYKIIKIFLNLTEDIEFEKVKKVSDEAISLFSEENLSFYDVEIFVDSEVEESETYPKIGYKYKTNSEFTWNR